MGDGRLIRQGVKRNTDRFPEDFMLQLDIQELAILMSQFVTSKLGNLCCYKDRFLTFGLAS
jgi:hypothetical protein